MIETLVASISAFDVAAGLGIALLMIDRFTNFLDKVRGIPHRRHDDVRSDLKNRRMRDAARHVWHTEEGAEALAKVRTLYAWHNKTDEDGVPIWYVRRGLERSVKQLSDNIAKQTNVLERLLEQDIRR